MDLPDNILDELDYLDNITSCNKVSTLFFIKACLAIYALSFMLVLNGKEN